MQHKGSFFAFSDGICRLAIRVKPNSQTSKILGFNTDRGVIEVALNAAPRDGEANDALIDLLRRVLRLSKDKIRIVSGHKSRDKIVDVECRPEDLEKL